MAITDGPLSERERRGGRKKNVVLHFSLIEKKGTGRPTLYQGKSARRKQSRWSFRPSTGGKKKKRKKKGSTSIILFIHGEGTGPSLLVERRFGRRASGHDAPEGLRRPNKEHVYQLCHREKDHLRLRKNGRNDTYSAVARCRDR